MKKYLLVLVMAVFLTSCSGGTGSDCALVCGDNCCQAGESCQDSMCLRECGSLSNCGNICVDLSESLFHCGGCSNSCGEGEICQAGECKKWCQDGTVLCGDRCVNLGNDELNCGECGNACVERETCKASNCTKVCLEGELSCAGECVNYLEDVKHCGRCFGVCEQGELCRAGTCAEDCGTERKLCADVCVDTDTDKNHCGDCDKPCPSGELCSSGQCVKDCAGLTNCGEQCVDLTSNAEHCGVCGGACGLNEICVGSACVCKSGFELCDGNCVDLSSSQSYCGDCNTKCGDDQICEKSQCIKACPEGETNCDDVCYDLTKTTRHCGRCYNACKLSEFAAEMICINSSCEVYNCDEDAKLCGGVCKDIQNDANNCGDCERKCASNERCVAGNCLWSNLLWGTNNDDEAFAMTSDSEGNLYVVGETNGVFSSQLAFGAKDAFLSKISPNGSVLWTKQWGTAQDDRAHAVVIGEDGMVYVGGTTLGSFETIITTAQRSAFLAKFDKNGERQFIKQFGSMYNDDLVAMAPAPLAGVYLAGHSEGNLGGFIVYGGKDIFILKISSSGSTVWKKQFGSSKDELLADLKVQGGSLYLLGTTYGVLHDGILPGNYISPNAFLYKASDDGTQIIKEWTKEFGSPRADFGRKLLVRSEEIEIVEAGETIKKLADFSYIYVDTELAQGGNFDGFPTPDKGVGIGVLKISEAGERVSSMLIATDAKYYQAKSIVEGVLKLSPTNKILALIAYEGSSANDSQAKPLVWQMLETGHMLNSSVYLNALRVNDAHSFGDFFYILGSKAVQNRGLELYLEKIAFSL